MQRRRSATSRRPSRESCNASRRRYRWLHAEVRRADLFLTSARPLTDLWPQMIRVCILECVSSEWVLRPIGRSYWAQYQMSVLMCRLYCSCCVCWQRLKLEICCSVWRVLFTRSRTTVTHTHKHTQKVLTVTQIIRHTRKTSTNTLKVEKCLELILKCVTVTPDALWQLVHCLDHPGVQVSAQVILHWI